jgi:hypothetical protein
MENRDLNFPKFFNMDFVQAFLKISKEKMNTMKMGPRPRPLTSVTFIINNYRSSKTAITPLLKTIKYCKPSCFV